NGHPNIVPYQVFETADGPMILAVGNDGQFRRFCEVAGIEAVARDERYGTNVARVRHREAVCEAVQAALRTRPRQYWLQSLEAVNVPCGPVNDLREVFEDPHVKERGAHLRMPCDWARDGAVSLLANPLKLSRTPVSYRRAPPRLNEHVDEILRDWGGGARA
ncbi:CoA transferase, partial [Achromobacter xylosoxidans]|nr:CoA transferase [Achromobacter xylosoxidans]